MVLNEILSIVSSVCICGAFYLVARKEKKENKKLFRQNQELAYKYANADKICDIQKEQIDGYKIYIESCDDTIKELNKIIDFDKEVLTKKTEQIGDLQEDLRKGADRFAKDQTTIADLNHELCEANYKVVELESEVEGMVKRGFVKLERARLLGGVR